ncbi:carotenoid oxygenase family protein [Microlunatus soli]|uniref:Dioxygenase n=1 Tax=Microlunatus soli TaxID=630515 RepID=A0A1H1PPG5_9ACTN|nr:carotenoid oxygenase family protein [Microlunatus soli]SDS12947.1 carotenoid cleavage dioxygenase [Microlunatus soli]
MATREARPVRSPADYADGGIIAPVPDEIDARDLEVIGSIPPELDGRYLRNGPNPLPGDRAGHWFVGRGMLHGVRIAGGRAQWYRNRWVDTDPASDDPTAAPMLDANGRDLRRNAANTHVIEHGGSLLVLCEGGVPYRVTPELGTVGAFDFSGRLRTAMTAHPKTDPSTGELYFYGYSATSPYLTFHVADAAGNLIASTPVDVPGPTMMHDFAITEHYVVWLDLPVVFRPGPRAGMPFVWDESYGARIGIMSRRAGRGGSAAVRWVDVDPCYVFHVGNAREDDHGRVILDAVRYGAEAFTAAWGAIGGSVRSSGGHGSLVADAGLTSVLHRWVIHPTTGAFDEEQLDDREIEFPSINEQRVGRSNRFLYAVSGSRNGGLIKYDTAAGSATVLDFDTRQHIGEAVFVPAVAASNEDDGWLISIVTPIAGSRSELHVMDATDVGAGPVARVLLPRRVPAGFHGSWIPERG